MRIQNMLRKSRYVSYLYQGSGIGGVLRQIARKLVAPIYQRESQYIVIRNFQEPSSMDLLNGWQDSSMTEGVIIESPEALREVQGEFEDAVLVDSLQARLAQGCVVFVARRPRKTGSGKVVVGYFICQRGMFSALGRQQKVSPDLLFGHHTEVLPSYRGQRIYQQLRATAFEYCRTHGLKTYCGVTTTYNRSSIQAKARTGETIVGTVDRVAVLGGLFVWETPWEKIEAAIRGTGE